MLHYSVAGSLRCCIQVINTASLLVIRWFSYYHLTIRRNRNCASLLQRQQKNWIHTVSDCRCILQSRWENYQLAQEKTEESSCWKQCRCFNLNLRIQQVKSWGCWWNMNYKDTGKCKIQWNVRNKIWNVKNVHTCIILNLQNAFAL